LPKGKLEKNESIESCALREIEEECQIDDLKIIKPLSKTHHCYQHKGKWILKISHWFLISCGDFSRIKPQAEEGITAIKWFSKEQFPIVYENTYASVTDLLKNYFN
jgi:8-oxo-dGTP pyrophosphatase MutT (NUDIX family)